MPANAFTIAVAQVVSDFGDLIGGTRTEDDLLRRELTGFIWTALAQGELDTGTQFRLAMPFGRLTLRDRFDTTHEAGLGDMEFRVRQRLDPWLFGEGSDWTLTVGLGVVAPTGLVSDPSDRLEENRQKAEELGLILAGGSGAIIDPLIGAEVYNFAATLGRGSWWMVGELDLQFHATDWLSLRLSETARGVVARENTTLRWAPEVVTALGVSVQPSPDHPWWRLQLGAQHVWRDRNEESGGVEIISSGGHWITLEPAVLLGSGEGTLIRLSGRIPVHRDVNGFQLVESWSAALSVAHRFSL